MHSLLIDAGGPSQRNGAELSHCDETAMTKADIDLMDEISGIDGRRMRDAVNCCVRVAPHPVP
jgi:hypothetical protein